MPNSPLESRLSNGRFANGVSAAAVVQLILDYDEAARIEDVARYFELENEDVAFALEYCDRRFEQLRAEGWLLR